MRLFFNKIFHNKSMVTIISVAVCLVVLFFGYRYRVNRAINAVNVPIATKQLKAREEITKDSIKTVKVAQSMITNNVIRSESNLIGRFVNYNTFIPEGSMFYESSVVDWSSMPDSAWSDIPSEHTIVSLSVNSSDTFGNSIFPGDTIDLFYQGVDSAGKTFIGELITGIKVLAVKDESGRHIFKKSSDQNNAAALIFSVPEDQHLLIRRAESIAANNSGKVFPVPRNANYKPESTTQGRDYIINYVNRNSKILQESDFSNTTSNDNVKITE